MIIIDKTQNKHIAVTLLTIDNPTLCWSHQFFCVQQMWNKLFSIQEGDKYNHE